MTLTASEVASLTSRIDRWEYAEYVFTALVAIACFGEYVADFTEWWRGGKAWKFLGDQDHRKDRVAKFSTLILIAALAGELVCVAKTNQLSGTLVGALGDRAEEAFAKSGDAIKNANAAVSQSDSAIRQSSTAIVESTRATKSASSALTIAHGARQEADTFEKRLGSAEYKADEAESHLNEALQRATSAESQAASVRQATAARRLSEPQKLELIRTLSATPMFSVSFLNVSSNDTREVFDLRDDLVEVFVRMGRMTPGDPPSGRGTISLTPSTARGVLVFVKNQREYPPAALALAMFLSNAGIAAQAMAEPGTASFRADEMRILVSPKQ